MKHSRSWFVHVGTFGGVEDLGRMVAETVEAARPRGKRIFESCIVSIELWKLMWRA